MAQMTGDSGSAAVIRDGSSTFTHDELRGAIDSLIGWLSDRGVGTGDLVTMWMPAVWQAVASYRAVFEMGGVAHSAADTLGPSDLKRLIQIAKPKAILVGASDPQRAKSMIEAVIGAGTDALVVDACGGGSDQLWAGPAFRGDIVPGAGRSLIFTSGTTAVPRGIIHGTTSLDAVCQDVEQRLELGSRDVVGLASPPGHIRWVMYAGSIPFRLGCGLLSTPKWTPEAWAKAAEEIGCTFAAFSPKHIHDLLGVAERGFRISTLRTVSLGGSYLPPDLLRRAEDVLGVRVVRTYGCTEFPSATASGPADEAVNRLFYDGRPLGSVEISVDTDIGNSPRSDGGSRKVGRIRLRGSHAAMGELVSGGAESRPITDNDGWVVTSDLGEIVNGHLKLDGRESEIIIRNGENISALELEEVLADCPGIAEVAIVGKRDSLVGERICAVIVPEGDGTVDAERVSQHMGAAGLAKWKWPELVIQIEELPRTPNGKIRRASLVEIVNGSPVSKAHDDPMLDGMIRWP